MTLLLLLKYKLQLKCEKIDRYPTGYYPSSYQLEKYKLKYGSILNLLKFSGASSSRL